MSIKRIADTVYTLRFLRLLVKDWTTMEAYKLGLIDEKGNKLKKATTPEEKNQYTLFHRLIYNLKRIIEKVPGGLARKFVSYASALYLIKEHTGLTEEEILNELNEMDIDLMSLMTEGNKEEETLLESGSIYQLKNDVVIESNIDMEAKSGTLVEIEENVGIHFNTNIYKAKHLLSNKTVYITCEDVQREILDDEFSVSTADVAMPDMPLPKPLTTRFGDKYQRFTVPTNVFQSFDKGRRKYQRWKKFLDLNDEKQNLIARFSKRHRDAVIVLQDEVTGAMRAIRPTSSDGL